MPASRRSAAASRATRPVEGIAELKDAIIGKFQRDNALDYERSQILVSTGAKQTIFNLVMAVIDPGDEAIIPAPYWVSYPDIVLLADGVPVMPYAGPEQGYKITPAQLEAAITPRTRLFILNSPSNPTGAAYTRAELVALGEVLLAHPRVLICTDDMYEHIYWGAEPFCSLLTAVPALYDRTVTVNGVSKSYAMTGWRIGYCGGPADDRAGDVDDPEPEHVEPELDRAEGCRRGADRRPGGRGDDERAVPARGTISSTPVSIALPGVRALPAAGTFYAWCDVSGACNAPATRTTMPTPSSCSTGPAWPACPAPDSVRPRTCVFRLRPAARCCSRRSTGSARPSELVDAPLP